MIVGEQIRWNVYFGHHYLVSKAFSFGGGNKSRPYNLADEVIILNGVLGSLEGQVEGREERRGEEKGMVTPFSFSI